MISNGTIVNATYQIICKINEVDGRMIYKARHLKAQKDVIMRQLGRVGISTLMDSAAIDMIKNISSPYLPKLYDVLTVNGEIYAIEEQKSGITFAEYVRQCGRLDYESAFRILMQLTGLLSILHAQPKPLVHGNIIPTNIIVNPHTGEISLINMDIARALGLTNYQPSDAYMAGFWSPEQYLVGIQGQYFPLNEATDVYCVGCVMYYALTGTAPDASFDRIVPIEYMGLNCKQGMLVLVGKMMSYQPEQRYENALVLREAIAGCYQKDDRYKSLKAIRTINIVFAAIFLGLGVILVASGILKNHVDDRNYYESCLAEADDYVNTQKYYDARAVIQDLENRYPKEIELYKREIEYMYLSEDYEDCISRADNISKKNFPKEFESDDYQSAAGFYHVLAQAYYRLGKYDKAQENIELAISLYGDDYEFYRDYCLILLEQDKIDKAEGQISVSSGLNWDQLELKYVEARIADASQDYVEAAEKYLLVIAQTKDDSTKKDAYSSCAAAYESMLDYASEAGLLEQALAEYPDEDDFKLQLAKTYMAWGDDDSFSATEYYTKSLQLYEELKVVYPEDFEIQERIVLLYRRLGRDTTAENMLLNMSEVFRDKYRVYMWLCYIEDEKQSNRSDEAKDYQQMEKYYSKAKKLYSSATKDFYMDDLEERMNELKEEGWFKK